MDFLSKVSAKANETFQTIKESEVTKKAKSYAGIPALQVQVGKCESQIKKAYEEMGKAYVEAHAEEEGGEYAEWFTVICDAQKKIGQLKAEIEEKKNYGENVADVDEKSVNIEKICPICGRSVPEESAFCSICGHQF